MSLANRSSSWSHRRQQFVPALGRARLQLHDVATVGPAELFQLGSNQPVGDVDVGAGKCAEKGDAARRVLGSQARRRHEHGASGCGHESATVHRSITSSA
jgi:hypothetical protein